MPAVHQLDRAVCVCGSRIRLITFHYDNAALHGPAVGTADCGLVWFQMQT